MRRVTSGAFLLLGLALLAAGCGDVATSTSTPTTRASAAATATAPKGATGPAVLGGTRDDFITKYGQPNDHSDGASLHFNRYPGSNIDALIVTFGPSSGGGPVRADDVSAQTSDRAHYRPADSKAGKTVSVADGSGAVVGEDDIYTSATLAPQFDASAFTDADGNTVAAGTFDVFYLYRTTNDPGHIDSCSLIIGSEQTKA